MSSPALDQRRPPWHLQAVAIVALLAMVAAGLTVGYKVTHAEQRASSGEEAVAENRDVLVALCSSLTTLRFVFEQLETLDRRLSSNETLAPSVRADVTARATLYATAVVALADTHECRSIE